MKKELKSIGFKKYLTEKNRFEFKNIEKYPHNIIEKYFSDYDKKRISYTIDYSDNNSNKYEYDDILSFTIDNISSKCINIKDSRKYVYSKYFNNVFRKNKIEKLLEKN